MLIISFPHNPTTAVVEPEFFNKIVAFAQDHDLIVIHDFAYADLVFDRLDVNPVDIPSLLTGMIGQLGLNPLDPTVTQGPAQFIEAVKFLLETAAPCVSSNDEACFRAADSSMRIFGMPLSMALARSG
jgi:hypothetical protein